MIDLAINCSNQGGYMARKETAKTNSRRGPRPNRRNDRIESLLSPNIKREAVRGYRNVIGRIGGAPLAFIASGIGAVLLGRFAFRYYKSHPEIREFLRDNFENIEGRIRELRGGSEYEIS